MDSLPVRYAFPNIPFIPIRYNVRADTRIHIVFYGYLHSMMPIKTERLSDRVGWLVGNADCREGGAMPLSRAEPESENNVNGGHTIPRRQ